MVIMPETSGWAGARTPLGPVWVRAGEAGIMAVRLQTPPAPVQEDTAPLARRACAAIAAWLQGGEWPRDLPLAPEGTPFQLRVWRVLCEIPPGHTLTYGELARRLETSPRAVGGACRANPVPLLIPCHRVVARNGLGGFAGRRQGAWPDLKARLLAHERKQPT